MSVNVPLQILRVPVLLLLVAVTGCDPDDINPIPSDAYFAEKSDAGLTSILTSAVEQQDVTNAALLVDVPSRSYRYRSASGIANEASGLVMTAADSFRIASMTKTLTATILLQLIEEGYLTLDTPLEDIFSDADMPDGFKLSELHVLSGIDRGGEITVHQLLNHTSGLEDYLSVSNDTDDGPDFLALLDALNGGTAGYANRQWSAGELLSGYFNNGRGNRPTGLPGEQHYYSDTNYLLLGMIIEKLTGDSYPNQLRYRILDPLGMSNSYLEWYEPVYGTLPVDHFIHATGSNDNSDNVNIIELGINTSFDWGGGGLVSTLDDLNIFMRALVGGELFQNRESLEQMKDWVQIQGDGFYGLGLERGSVRDYEYYGHTGIWGGNMFYFPKLNTTIVLWINQVVIDRNDYLQRILDALAESGRKMSNDDLESIIMGRS